MVLSTLKGVIHLSFLEKLISLSYRPRCILENIIIFNYYTTLLYSTAREQRSFAAIPQLAMHHTCLWSKIRGN